MNLTKEQKQEIADQQAQKSETKRVTSPELEKEMHAKIIHTLYSAIRWHLRNAL